MLRLKILRFLVPLIYLVGGLVLMVLLDPTPNEFTTTEHIISASFGGSYIPLSLGWVWITRSWQSSTEK